MIFDDHELKLFCEVGQILQKIFKFFHLDLIVISIGLRKHKKRLNKLTYRPQDI